MEVLMMKKTSPTKKGLLLTNAYYSPEGAKHQAKRLKQEFKKLGVTLDVKKNNFFACYLDNSCDLVKHIKDYDFCIYLNKDKYISRLLEQSGLKLFNSHQAIVDCDDKMETFIKLAGHNIPVPITLPGLLCHSKSEPLKKSTIKFVEKTLGYPLIMKSSYGSYGTGIHKIDNRDQLIEHMEQLKMRPHLYQQYIPSSYGKDIRVMLIGHKVVSAMVRQSTDDFRSNLALGGTATPYTLPKELNTLCVKVSKVLNLDFCGIDVLFGEDNNYYICEVNSNAHFKGSESATSINIAGKYAKYIYDKMYTKK